MDGFRDCGRQLGRIEAGLHVVSTRQHHSVGTAHGLGHQLALRQARQQPRHSRGGPDRQGVVHRQTEGGVAELEAFAGGAAGDEDEGRLYHSTKLHFREPFANAVSEPVNLFRAQQAASDSAAHGVEQCQPILQWWMCQRLPLGGTAFAHIEVPSVANVMRINLQPDAIVGAPPPTDFRLRHRAGFLAPGLRMRGIWDRAPAALGFAASAHWGNSTLATAMAAMPSSRPTKPRCSLVVALRPTLAMGMPSASARRVFMASTCGAIFGCWAMRVASMFTILPLRAATWRPASRKKTWLGTPLHRGSVLGKKWPMSPSTNAARKGSQ